MLEGSVKEGRLPINRAIIKIIDYKNNKEIDHIITNTAGLFNINLGLNKNYLLIFQKEGYISKRLFFNTEVPFS